MLSSYISVDRGTHRLQIALFFLAHIVKQRPPKALYMGNARSTTDGSYTSCLRPHEAMPLLSGVICVSETNICVQGAQVTVRTIKSVNTAMLPQAVNVTKLSLFPRIPAK